MKIILINEFRKVMVKDEEAEDIHDIIDLFCDALVGLSFSQQTIENGIRAKAETYEEENE